MCGNYDIGPTPVQLLQNGDGERKALSRVCPRRQLIDQQQHASACITQHPLYTLHLGREGAQRLCEALSVSDHTDHIREYCKVTVFLHGNQQSGLYHRGQEAQCLEDNCFPAGIWAGNNQ
ncbi:hypothetical protein D3C85_1481000 [compost metagenome]